MRPPPARPRITRPRPRCRAPTVPARSKARKRALDVLYEAEIRGEPTCCDLLGERAAGAEPAGRRVRRRLVRGVQAHRAEIDELLAEHSRGWTLDRMPAVDRNILRIGAYELLWAATCRRRRGDQRGRAAGPRPVHRRLARVRQRAAGPAGRAAPGGWGRPGRRASRPLSPAAGLSWAVRPGRTASPGRRPDRGLSGPGVTVGSWQTRRMRRTTLAATSCTWTWTRSTPAWSCGTGRSWPGARSSWAAAAAAWCCPRPTRPARSGSRRPCRWAGPGGCARRRSSCRRPRAVRRGVPGGHGAVPVGHPGGRAAVPGRGVPRRVRRACGGSAARPRSAS